MNQISLFIPFAQAQNYPSSLVGEQGKMKSKLAEARLPVASGYIITSHVFHELLTPQLKYQLTSALQLLDPHDPRSVKAATTQFRRFINRMTIPEGLALQLTQLYQKVNKHGACRLTGSLSHQTTPITTVYTKGDANFLIDLRKCWADIFESALLVRLVEHKLAFDSLYPVILVENFATPKISGRLSTQNPHNGNKKTMLIEAVWGMSEYLTNHSSEADSYEIDKQNWDVINTQYTTQEKEFTYLKNDVTLQVLPNTRKKTHKLNENQLLKLAHIGKKLHSAFFFPQECVWEIDKNNDITLVSLAELQESQLSQSLSVTSAKPLIYGVSVHKGQISGKAKVLKNFSVLEKYQFSKDEILVVKHIHPSQMSQLNKVGGIICEASLLPRDFERLHVPCIANTQVATSAIRDGQMITMFADYGVVFDGTIDKVSNTKSTKQLTTDNRSTDQLMWWYEPERPSRLSPEIMAQATGIGPITGKSIVQMLNIHPQVLKQRNKLELLEQALYEYLQTILQTSDGKPVVYELIDMTSSQYRQLPGAEAIEPVEENSLLGYHGAYRLLLEKEIVELQLRLLHKLGETYPTKIAVCIPFVRTVDEWVLIKKMIDQLELKIPVWVGIDTPSSALNFHHFVHHGASGGVIHEHQLFSLFTATQLDQPHDLSPQVEHNDGYFQLLAFVASTAQKMKIPVLYANHNGHTDSVDRVKKNGIKTISLTRTQFEQIVEK